MLTRYNSYTTYLAIVFAASLLAMASPSMAQNNASGVYIDPERGTRNWRTSFNTNGNQVESIVTNWGTVGRGNFSINQAGVWPKGTGHGHLHEMTGLVASRVADRDGKIVELVSDGYGDSAQQDIDPVTNVEWKFQPLPDYFNRNVENPEIANSLNPESWPRRWPDRPSQWDGQWNGYFGLNQFNADQELFYVMDDLSNNEYKFGPLARDPRAGGLGLQIRVRIFQWSQALAKDILFMQYEVSNIGDIVYNNSNANNPIYFGGYTDVNPAGSGSTDDAADFELSQDIVFGWALSGVGTWGQFRDIPPGYIGWKFLESPGISDDFIDNDNDGLIDESRDNGAGQLIFGPVGRYGDPKEHWSGDEDGDWNVLVDDVGSDGIGPGFEGYPGPDPDGTEGNGRPDQGEPNFGRLDNDESDQVGLTSFNAPLFGSVNIHNEAAMWPKMQPGFFDIPAQGVNQIWIFASGPFRLRPDRSERFSTCFVFGANRQSLFRSAQVAQRIYDSDYRFARPPRQPKLKALAGDGKVTLIWDNLAEFSRDPIYGFDFEGYRIIKSTDPQFNDAQDITDAFGNSVYKRSIAQFDKVNGLKGYHKLQFGEEIGLPNGVHFFMGDDTGLQHSYIDTDVINGRVYYYAVLSYDAGYVDTYFDLGISDSPLLFPISPSESPGSITVTQGVVTRYDANTVSARPNNQPSDEILGKLSVDAQSRVPRAKGDATSLLQAFPINERAFIDTEYTISFEQEPVATTVEYGTKTYTVKDKSGRAVVSKAAVPKNPDGTYVRNWTEEIFDEGFLLVFNNAFPTQTYTQQNSRFSPTSRSNLRTAIQAPLPTTLIPNPPLWPINVAIDFGEETAVMDTAFINNTGLFTRLVNFKLYEEGTNENINFIINELPQSTNGRIDVGESIDLVFRNRPNDFRYTQSWKILFNPPVDANGNELPASQAVLPRAGDRFVLRTQKPFGARDEYVLKVSATKINDEADKSLLEEITVVPNPYIAATITESRPFLSGRGERRIEIRKLPTTCRVRIFSASGVFLRELEPSKGVAVWDLKTKEGLEVSFGLYFFHVDAPGIGEKVGKFAIIN